MLRDGTGLALAGGLEDAAELGAAVLGHGVGWAAVDVALAGHGAGGEEGRDGDDCDAAEVHVC